MSPLVIAHRGASLACAENTVTAFLTARELGADWVELDVHPTLDRRLAVHHDFTLSDGRGIRTVRAEHLPATIPLLAAALHACTGMGVNVEIKFARDGTTPELPDHIARSVAEHAQLVVDALRESAFGGPLLVTSFERSIIDAVADCDSPPPTGLLVAPPVDPFDALRSLAGTAHRALNPADILVGPELVRAARAAGLALNVWTVDSPARIAELAEWGVDGIITNAPDIARAALADARA